MNKMCLQKLTEIVEKELDQLTSKGSLTPTELDSAKKSVDLLAKIEEYSMMCEESSMPGYSERSRFNGMRAYAYPPEVYSPMHYESQNSSYGSGNWNATMNGRYSGHSIKDRMIDRLERMMDDASSEYERKEIRNEIARLRQET